MLKSCLVVLSLAAAARAEDAAAETARWLVHESNWGYLTYAGSAEVLSLSDGAVDASTGRLWFYVMGWSGGESYVASLTLSQAALSGMTCNNTDPEDPRCAKLTIAGKMVKATGGAAALGKAALFARHPQMQKWPAGHDFGVWELVPSDLWMIDFYGGASLIDPKAYLAATPRHNVPGWGQEARLAAAAPKASVAGAAPPPWNHTAARARWLVYHAIWGSVGTHSVRLHQPWGNVRSVADGVGANSSGLPVLYLPTPDPTAIDVRADPNVTLSFSEAALPERLSPSGAVCGGMVAEDPTCARLHMAGRLRALRAPAELAQAKIDLGARHPLAPWLAKGGAHTGGIYYKIELDSLTFLDFYGGAAQLSVEEFLAAKSPKSME